MEQAQVIQSHTRVSDVFFFLLIFIADAFFYYYRSGERVDRNGGGTIIPLPAPYGHP